MSLVPTLKLSLEMTNTLSQIERNGLRINLDTLADIRKQYEEEMQELETRLMQLARDARINHETQATGTHGRERIPWRCTSHD